VHDLGMNLKVMYTAAGSMLPLWSLSFLSDPCLSQLVLGQLPQAITTTGMQPVLWCTSGTRCLPL
jgi:hypothetical protein